VPADSIGLDEAMRGISHSRAPSAALAKGSHAIAGVSRGLDFSLAWDCAANPVSAVPFGLIQCLVGGGDQTGRAVIDLRQGNAGRRAGADGDNAVVAAAVLDLQAGNGATYTFGDIDGAVLVGGGQQNHQFLAAVAGRQVGRTPQGLGDRDTDTAQALVAGGRSGVVRTVVAAVVDAGVVTSGGVSLAIDATLYLLGRLYGVDAAEDVARVIEYDRAYEANRAELGITVNSPANRTLRERNNPSTTPASP
jgi:hypothetical protein